KVAMDDITTGAAQDMGYATEIARRMVCEWGMSEALGPVTFGKEEHQIFLGREMGRVKDHSEATAVVIDREIRTLVEEASARAEKLLSDNRDKLELLAEALLEHETLSGEDVDELFGVAPKNKGGSEKPTDDEASPGDGADEPAKDVPDAPEPDLGAKPPTE
ncbi:MAG TPA: cell division protein FtsH, partial [bacterium]|nr:cell division protein FtsH [bacterium]